MQGGAGRAWRIYKTHCKSHAAGLGEDLKPEVLEKTSTNLRVQRWLARSCLEAEEYTSLALSLSQFANGIANTLCFCLCNKPKGLDVRRSVHQPRHRRPYCAAINSSHPCQPLVRKFPPSCIRHILFPFRTQPAWTTISLRL